MVHAREFGAMVREIMTQHNLFELGWDYGLDRAKRRLGLCDYSEKMLVFSLPIIEANSLDILRDTVLHETAHALVGRGHGHSNVWKMMAMSIGARPVSCSLAYEEHIPVPGRYIMICDCPNPHYRHRKPNGFYRCKQCNKMSRYVLNEGVVNASRE